MKVTYVVPRYGEEVIGGAEYGARMLAEHLAADGVEVEVCTTCALDARTWANVYPEGTTPLNGVTVRRFRSIGTRHPRFDELSGPVLADPAAVSPADERRWLELQGPVCPEVLDQATSSGADLIIFYPYLYWPTVEGVLRVGPRSVLHPATHDEAPIRLPVFRRVFETAGALVFQTAAERSMTERFFPAVSAHPQAVIGLGVIEAPGDVARARAETGVGDRPFLLCLGRMDEGKGSLLLYRFFTAYKKRHPGPLALLFVGPVVDQVPAHPDVVVAGTRDEAVKWGALRAASILVSPSPLESFSLALLEGWTAARPVLVNDVCEATRHHVQTSGGGLTFDSYASFEVGLDRLLDDRATSAAMGRAGQGYVEARYGWTRLSGRYRRFLESQAVRAAGQPRPSVPGK